MVDLNFSRTEDSLGAYLEQVLGWCPGASAGAAFDRTGAVTERGATGHVFPLASVSKLATALAILIACEERTLSLSDPLGPAGSTVRHVLAHASGLAFDTDDVQAAAGTKRIYSNTGYELLADHLAQRSGIPFAEYLREAVLNPLGMSSTELLGSPAAGLHSTVGDVIRLGLELARPTLIDRSTWSDAISVQFPGLAGVLPGWGFKDPCDWGLGPELKGTKDPHWMGSSAPPWTLGHFGASGTFLWVDPVAGIGCAVLTERDFGKWAMEAWPDFSDRVRSVLVGGV